MLETRRLNLMGWVVSFSGWPAVHNFDVFKKHQISMEVSTNTVAQDLYTESFS